MSARINLTIDAGCDHHTALQWLDSTNTPHELADAVLDAHIRERFLHESPTADPVAEFTVTGDDDGWIHLLLTEEQTAAIPPGVYVWDLAATDATDDIPRKRVAHGAVTVHPAVTARQEES